MNGLGSINPNVLPLDAFELQEESASSKIIAGRDEWRFGSAISGSKWVTGREYKSGDIVWNPADKLTYVALVDNSSVEPDYTDTGVEGVTWGWVAGTVTGYVAGPATRWRYGGTRRRVVMRHTLRWS